uniref:C-type lectin domain-containing protein n=1 Tax=Macrostomum lignano TaxID=282301 RepID=A0A1I8FGN4_9PLAT
RLSFIYLLTGAGDGVGGARATCCTTLQGHTPPHFSLHSKLAGSLALSDRIFSACTAGFSKLMASMRLLLLAFIGLGLPPIAAVRAASSSCLPASPWLADARYEQDLGVCHYFRAAGSRQQVNFSTAESWCRDATSVSNLPSIRLVRLSTDQSSEPWWCAPLTQVGIGYSNLWTEAQCNGSTNRYSWGTGSEVTELKSVACNSSLAVKFTGHVIPAADGSYKVNSVFSAVTLDNLGTHVCEYDVPRCDMSTASNFNWTRMQPDVDSHRRRSDRQGGLRPGFFRTSEVDGTADSLIRNRATAVNTSAILPPSHGESGGRIMYTSTVWWTLASPLSCQGSVLLNLNLQVDFKETYRNRIDPNREYLVRRVHPVECKTGYVKDHQTVRTSTPPSTVVRERYTEAERGRSGTPSSAPPSGATSRQCQAPTTTTPCRCTRPTTGFKDRTYTSSETHMFPYYPNTVYVRCSTPGQFFRDRKYAQDLPVQPGVPNSTIEATWSPRGGHSGVLHASGFAMSTVNDTTGKFMSAREMSAAIDEATSGKKFVRSRRRPGSVWRSLWAPPSSSSWWCFFTLIVMWCWISLRCSRDIIKLLKQNIRRLKLKASMKKNS